MIASPIAPPRIAPAPHGPRATLALVPLDGTPQAERALPFAIAHARASGDRLILAGNAQHPAGVVAATAGAGLTPPGPAPAAPPLALYLRQIAETLAERGLAARVSICGGAGAQAIADAARLWGADLVIMAAHDFGGPRGEVKSLAKTVMQRAAVPVLLIPAPGANAAREDLLVEWRGWHGAGTGQDGGHGPVNEGGQA
jgi:nucleotide-binding universal stress UspA family protein